jgi:hypothetical protein
VYGAAIAGRSFRDIAEPGLSVCRQTEKYNRRPFHI